MLNSNLIGGFFVVVVVSVKQCQSFSTVVLVDWWEDLINLCSVQVGSQEDPGVPWVCCAMATMGQVRVPTAQRAWMSLRF